MDGYAGLGDGSRSRWIISAVDMFMRIRIGHSSGIGGICMIFKMPPAGAWR